MKKLLHIAASLAILFCVLLFDPAASAADRDAAPIAGECSGEEHSLFGSSVTCLAIPMEHVADMQRMIRTGTPGIPLVQLFSTPRADGAHTLWFSPDKGCDRLDCRSASHNHWRP